MLDIHASKEDKLTLVLISRKWMTLPVMPTHVIVMGTVAKTGTPGVFSQTTNGAVCHAPCGFWRNRSAWGSGLISTRLTVEALADLLMAHLPAKEGTGMLDKMLLGHYINMDSLGPSTGSTDQGANLFLLILRSSWFGLRHFGALYPLDY